MRSTTLCVVAILFASYIALSFQDGGKNSGGYVFGKLGTFVSVKVSGGGDCGKCALTGSDCDGCTRVLPYNPYGKWGRFGEACFRCNVEGFNSGCNSCNIFAPFQRNCGDKALPCFRCHLGGRRGDCWNSCAAFPGLPQPLPLSFPDIFVGVPLGAPYPIPASIPSGDDGRDHGRDNGEGQGDDDYVYGPNFGTFRKFGNYNNQVVNCGTCALTGRFCNGCIKIANFGQYGIWGRHGKSCFKCAFEDGGADCGQCGRFPQFQRVCGVVDGRYCFRTYLLGSLRSDARCKTYLPLLKGLY